MPPYRLSLDLGANSVGWAALRLDAAGVVTGLIDLGVRVFPDGRNPKDKSSLALARRIARGARRRRARFVERRGDLMGALVRHGLMPADPAARKALEAADPYELRARGLDEALDPHLFGRALFHLNQRRGFKSNRKADGDPSERGKIRQGVAELKARMAESGARTVGEYFAQRHARRETVRARLQGSGTKAEYPFYPARELLEAEFDALWAAQTRFRPALPTEAARAEIREAIFFQRPLQPVRPGRCALIPTEERAPAALPLAQRFRLLQELANLRLILPDDRRTQRPLTRRERDLILDHVARKSAKEVTFVQIRRLLKLDSDIGLSHESERRDRLKADETAAALAHKARFGAAWAGLSLAERTEIVLRLLEEEDEAALTAWLQDRWGLSAEAAQATAEARLPSGFARLSVAALGRVVPAMEDGAPDDGADRPLRYDEAAKRAGLHHSDFRPGELRPRLPYYGAALSRHVAFGSGDPRDPADRQFGRVANPTVHIALNQLRRVVNAAVAQWGPPTEIHVELLRDLKQSMDKKREEDRRQAENQRKNDERRKRLRDELGILDPSGRDLLKMRLWEEQGGPEARLCVYSGEPISLRRLIEGDVEIDHILPFSQTLDDSAANKVVVVRGANRGKGNQAPFDAFSAHPDWPDILARAEALPANKRWRFAADAMERWSREEDGFLARHLVDSKHVAKLAREYLSTICPAERIVSSPGKLTAILRRRWGFESLLGDHNRKNRNDHRHHAVDALTVGLIDRSMLQALQTAAGRALDLESDRLFEGLPDPWPGFDRDALRAKLAATVASHKPDHAPQGRLHNDTAYGLIDPAPAGGASLVVHRVPLDGYKSEADLAALAADARRYAGERAEAGDDAAAQSLAALADQAWTILAALDADPDGGSFAERMARFMATSGMRRIRIPERLAVIPIADRRTGRPYKAYKGDGNHAYVVAVDEKGRWRGSCLSTFDANQPPERRRVALSADPIMVLRKDDLLAADGEDGRRRILRVVKFSGSSVVLADHFEAGDLKKRDADPDDPFKYLNCSAERLRAMAARPVRVDPLGRVHERGDATAQREREPA